jgi:hypothetical protein
MIRNRTFFWTALAGALIAPGLAAAEGVDPGVFVANNVWMMLCAALVFIMHLGFAMVESGLTRAKNTTNILFKNTFIICCGILTYFICGFNLMYPGDFNGFFGFAGFGLAAGFDEGANGAGYADGGYTYWTDFLFQAMFAATAATIVSGAVAERIKLGSFMIFSAIFVALVYTVAGSWKWGGGFLDGAGFYDFAGSTLVHSVGGWAALVGALGQRWWARWSLARVSASTARTDRCIRSQVVRCRSRRSASSCCGSDGLASTAAPCCRRIPRPRPSCSSRPASLRLLAVSVR